MPFPVTPKTGKSVCLWQPGRARISFVAVGPSITGLGAEGGWGGGERGVGEGRWGEVGGGECEWRARGEGELGREGGRKGGGGGGRNKGGPCVCVWNSIDQ